MGLLKVVFAYSSDLFQFRVEFLDFELHMTHWQKFWIFWAVSPTSSTSPVVQICLRYLAYWKPYSLNLPQSFSKLSIRKR